MVCKLESTVAQVWLITRVLLRVWRGLYAGSFTILLSAVDHDEWGRALRLGMENHAHAYNRIVSPTGC